MYQYPYPMGGSDPTPEPRQQYEVHCGRCHWWGCLQQLKTIYIPSAKEVGDVVPEAACPQCLSDMWLEYEEKE